MTKYTIKELRTDSKIKQREMADYLGIHINSYKAYENGERSIPAEIFSGICDYFEISRDKVIIPHCKQKFSHVSLMSNKNDENTYLYKKGYKKGYQDGINEVKNRINFSIKDLIEVEK